MDADLVATLVDRPGPSVLVVDFAQFSGEETVAEKLHRVLDGYALHRIDAVTAAGSDLVTTPLHVLAQRCGAEIRGKGIAPHVIVGYCSASTLSLLIARDLERHGGTHPPVILVEPTWVELSHIAAESAALQESLGVGHLIPDPSSLDAVLSGARSALHSRLRADDISEAEVELTAQMLMQRYEAWFGFLFSTLEAELPVPSGRVRLVLGHDNSTTTPADWPDSLVSIHRLAAEGLPSRTLADAVLEAA
jgi:hypothetical protein